MHIPLFISSSRSPIVVQSDDQSDAVHELAAILKLNNKTADHLKIEVWRCVDTAICPLPIYPN